MTPAHRTHLEPARKTAFCRKCSGVMAPGKALEQTYTGIPDFIGCEVMTVSPGGHGRLIDCSKCTVCGWSTT